MKISLQNKRYLTNKEAQAVYYTVIKHDGHLTIEFLVYNIGYSYYSELKFPQVECVLQRYSLPLCVLLV